MVLSIVLRILAGLGIAVLCVLAFLLAVILLVLILPICYRGAVEKKKDTELVANGSVSLFLRAIRLTIGYDGVSEEKMASELYIFGIPMSALQKRRKKRQESKEKKSTEARKKKARRSPAGQTADRPTDPGDVKTVDGGADQQTGRVTGQRKRPTVEPGQRKGTETQESETRTAVSITKENAVQGGDHTEQTKDSVAPEIVKAKRPNFIIRISAKIVSFVNGLRAKIRKLMDLLETLGDWMDYFATEKFNRFKRLVIRQLIAILRHCLPRKIRGTVHYGLEDPAMTGKILAVICAVYPVLPGKLKIDPDFEEQVIEADVSFRGHIVPAVILYRGLRIVLCRELWVLLRRVRNINKGNVRAAESAVS